MPLLYATAYLVFSGIILYNFNKLTNKLCDQKEIPVEKQDSVYRTVNVCITILLLSIFFEVSFT